MGILEKVEPALCEVDPLVREEGNCRYIWDVQVSGEPVFFSSETASLELSGKVWNISWAGVLLWG